VNITATTISCRGGLTFISHYIEKIKFFRLINKKVSGFRSRLKGKATSFIIRQILWFFINGSHKAISGFDLLKKDEGYASVLEVSKEDLVSSHAVKRFFKKFTYFKCDILRKILNATPLTNFKEYSRGKKIWHYTEFGSKLDSWKKVGFLRTIFTPQLCDDNGQMLLDIARPDSVLYTNIGCNAILTAKLEASGHKELISTEKIIEWAHNRGCNELCNRSIKDFRLTEKLPFKRFGMNAAYYYLMLIGHTLNECYKTDVVNEADIPHIHLNCYPATFRRNFVDFAVQIVTTGGSIALQVMKGVWENLKIKVLWELCQSSNRIPIPLL